MHGLVAAGETPGRGAARPARATAGELADAAALYASVLPRAARDGGHRRPRHRRTARRRWRTATCASCTRARPTASPGTSSASATASPTSTSTPTAVVAPGGESWSVVRGPGLGGGDARWPTRIAASCVVIVCHAGVIESTLLAFLPVAPGAAPAAAAHRAHLAHRVGDGRRGLAPGPLQRRRPPATSADSSAGRRPGRRRLSRRGVAPTATRVVAVEARRRWPGWCTG